MNEDKKEKETMIPLRPFMMKELLEIYGVSRNTFKKWIKPMQKLIGKREGNYYSIAQVKIIFSGLQLPSNVIVKDDSEYKLYDRMQPKLDK